MCTCPSCRTETGQVASTRRHSIKAFPAIRFAPCSPHTISPHAKSPLKPVCPSSSVRTPPMKKWTAGEMRMGRFRHLALNRLSRLRGWTFHKLFGSCPEIHADGPRLPFRHQHGGEDITLPNDGLIDIAQVVLLQEILPRRTDQGRLPWIRGVDHHHRHVGLVENDGIALDELHVPQVEPGACGQVIPLPHDRCLVVVLRIDGACPATGQDDGRRADVSLAPAQAHAPDAHDALGTPQQCLRINAPLWSDPVAPGDQRGNAADEGHAGNLLRFARIGPSTALECVRFPGPTTRGPQPRPAPREPPV